MWNDNESEGCIYDTVDCNYCNVCGKLYKQQCEQFGNLDGMSGSCHYCKEESIELFKACWDREYSKVETKSTKYTPTLQFEYKNWQGKISIRKVIPYKIWFGNTNFHKDEQYLLHVYDIDKCAERNFALKDVIKFM